MAGAGALAAGRRRREFNADRVVFAHWPCVADSMRLVRCVCVVAGEAGSTARFVLRACSVDDVEPMQVLAHYFAVYDLIVAESGFRTFDVLV